MKRLNHGLRLLCLAALSALSWGMLSGQALAAGDAAAGAEKAHTCLGCHGVKHYVNTYPTYHVPRIAGQHEAYLVSALQAYRGKLRDHGTMQANAGLLTDQDIEDISAFFAAQGLEEHDSNYSDDSDKVEAGQAKAATCAACHGDTGFQANAPTNPVLAGQYKTYLQQALKSYRSGARQNAIMAGFSSQLTDEDIEDLSAWFSSQESPLKTAE